MNNILQSILADKKAIVQRRKQQIPLPVLMSQPMTEQRGFTQVLAQRIQQQKPAVIAEIKKASPSKGIIREDFDPIAIAQSYQAHGAHCLSVLTDENFFKGRDEYLQQVRKAVTLPLLRKDFIVDEYQIYESKVLGADCILLIAAALDLPSLQAFYQLAMELKLDVLLEVHNAAELAMALQTPCQLIGINNRDLNSFSVDLATTTSLAKVIPQSRMVITESGIHQWADVDLLLSQGVYGFLIGEALMRKPSPGEGLAELFGANLL